MSEQPLDLKRSLHILRRHWIAVCGIAFVGLLAGAGYAVRYPPMVSSSALVVLPSSKDMSTQVVIADSDPVLAGALRRMESPMSLQTLSARVHVTKLTANALSISAEGKTTADAVRTTNAVADSYVAYLGTGNSPLGKVPARLLQPAATATGTSAGTYLLVTAGVGALAGLLVGAIGVLAIRRGDRRLRQRDQIADAIGVPVLASLHSVRPPDAARWARLLADYEPSAADAWRLRNALDLLGLADVSSARTGQGGYSLGVISLASDRRALALGPQLAVFAASQGISTALVIGPQQETNTTAALRAACTASPSPRPSSRLLAAVVDHGSQSWLPDAALTVVVIVVDGKAPQVAGAMRTNATLLAVSAGAATAEQLARIAASANADGHHLAGILVADPEPGDQTTGRLPQLARPALPRMPTRMTGTATETRR